MEIGVEMKLRNFNLLNSHRDTSSLDRDSSVVSQCPFRGIVYAVTGFCLALMLVSCGEKPAGRMQISNDLSMILTKQMPLQQSVMNGAVGPASDFDKAILQAVEANEAYRAARSFERELVASIGVAESVRRWQIAATSTIGGVRERGGTKPSKTTTGIAGGIQASQLIYDGG
ncbi:MAG TPA: hypothetical protein DEX33_01110, partial [Cellvibrionales bacterium]|nr:hypothetical protein [Cellvibrionales bacterium]